MKLSDERYEEIKAEVIDLFVRFDMRCIPISGFELAIKMGITLVPYSSLSPKKLSAAYRVSMDGFYFEPGGPKEQIFYNDNVGYRRTNMTLLHEIGHCVLGHNDYMDQDEAETEAKFFAKYAATPPPLVHRIMPNGPEDIEENFMVSHEAAIYAYKYYQKWLIQHYQTEGYVAYEQDLLQLFKESA